VTRESSENRDRSAAKNTSGWIFQDVEGTRETRVGRATGTHCIAFFKTAHRW
jgi:hypothetical protein